MLKYREKYLAGPDGLKIDRRGEPPVHRNTAGPGSFNKRPPVPAKEAGPTKTRTNQNGSYKNRRYFAGLFTGLPVLCRSSIEYISSVKHAQYFLSHLKSWTHQRNRSWILTAM